MHVTTKYCLSFERYTDDLMAMMVERVNLGDVTHSHLKSLAETLKDYAHYGEASKSGALECSFRQGTYMMLVALFDFALSVRGEDRDKQSWKRSKLSAVRHTVHNQLSSVELLAEVFGDLVLCVPATSRGKYGILRDKTPQAWMATKISVKSELGYWANRIGLKLGFRTASNSDRTGFDNKVLRCCKFQSWRCLFAEEELAAMDTQFRDFERQVVEVAVDAEVGVVQVEAV
ncbi:hypothetical protein V1504DRAFT_430053 [Lipomyces starkeyi]